MKMINQNDFQCDSDFQSINNINFLVSSIQDGKMDTQPQNQLKFNFQTLIKLHHVYGNKWKDISNMIPNTTDSFIKNMFYTFTRKALRKINLFIEQNSKNNKKKPKTFKLNFVFKLGNLAESERINMSCHYYDDYSIQNCYTKLLYNFLEIGNLDNALVRRLSQPKLNNSSLEDQNLRKQIDSLIQNLKTIQKIFIQQNLTKKGRTKKKFPKKGLIQKAYSSKAFKMQHQQFPDCMSIHSIQTNQHSKQYKQYTQFYQRQQQIKLQQVDITLKNFDLIQKVQTNEIQKNQLEKMFQRPTFDPILFQ